MVDGRGSPVRLLIRSISVIVVVVADALRRTSRSDCVTCRQLGAPGEWRPTRTHPSARTHIRGDTEPPTGSAAAASSAPIGDDMRRDTGAIALSKQNIIDRSAPSTRGPDWGGGGRPLYHLSTGISSPYGSLCTHRRSVMPSFTRNRSTPARPSAKKSHLWHLRRRGWAGRRAAAGAPCILAKVACDHPLTDDADKRSTRLAGGHLQEAPAQQESAAVAMHVLAALPSVRPWSVRLAAFLPPGGETK